MGFWMEMRTGKSTACIDTIRSLSGFPVLVICPLGLIPVWQNEFKENGFPDHEIEIIRPIYSRNVVTAKNKFCNSTAKIFITNFDSIITLDALNIRSAWVPSGLSAINKRICRVPDWLNLPDWKSIIADESYRIANSESNITKYLLGSPLQENQHRFCLSGSPASEHPYDFASQYIFMYGEYFGYKSVDKYMHTFWDYNEFEYRWKVKDPYHILDIRKCAQTKGYCKTMDELGLGATIFYDKREIPISEIQKDILAWLKIANTYTQKETGELMVMEPIVRATFEHEIASGIHPLTGEIISDNKTQDAIQYYRDKPQQMVIVNRFKPLVRATADAFNKAGIRAAYIDGDVTNIRERERIREAFQAGYLDIISGQVKTIKMGLDFSALDTVLIMSNSWSHDDRVQVEKRGDHTQRTRPYLIIDQQTIGTNDEVLTNVLTVKKKNARFFIKEFNENIFKQN